MDDHTRNYFLALALSIVVVLIWSIFVIPQEKADEQAVEQARQETQEAEGTLPRKGAEPGVQAPSDAASPQQGAAAQIRSREEVLATTPRIAIETPALKGSIGLRGARIDDLTLLRYRVTVSPNSPNVILFAPAGSERPFFAYQGWSGGPGSTLKLPTADTLWEVENGSTLRPETPVSLVWNNDAGLIFRRTISVDGDYMFTVRQEVENLGGAPVTLYPHAEVARFYQPPGQGFWILHEGFTGVFGEEGQENVDYDDAIEDGKLEFPSEKGGWAGITDKYWAAVVIPDQNTAFEGSFAGNDRFGRPSFQAGYLTAPVTIEAGSKSSVEGHLFAGAKRVKLIDAYDTNLGIERFELLIDWGWLYFLTKPLFYALDYFYKLVGNFGLAILIVTVIIKLIFFPLANKSYVSMSRMKKLQPQLERLKERFKDDKMRQQQAMMDLYKTEKVSPAAGCLPMVVQIPVFFALYKVLFVTIEMRHAPFYGWIKDLSAPDPTTVFNLFGLLPWNPAAYLPIFLMVGAWPIIMGLTMFVQMKLNPAPTDPTQAMLFAWMPLFFTFILAPFPAGLVIYWAWNNFLSLSQQYFIMHRQGVDIALWENLGFKSKQAGERSKP